MNYYVSVLKKYAVFNGRAGRAEYWYFFLFNIIAYIIIGVIGGAIMGDGSNILVAIYTLGIFLPALGVTIRRLHDTGRSGWWVFISAVPAVGGLILLILLALKSQPGANEYGAGAERVADVV